MHNILVDYSNHIAIIGAGISGLTLACILKNAKIPVVVFEKSNDVSDHGAGISISPNGIRVLKYLNIYDDAISKSANPKEAIYSSINKKIATFKVDVITTSRKVLYEVLYKKFIGMGGTILFNHQLSKVDIENLKLYFSNNTSYKVRHIAACDGIKSICRNSIESQKDPLYSGYSVWRAIINKNQKNIKTYLGPNHHIVTYPISASQISFVAAIKTKKKYKESWRTSGTLNELKEDLILSDTKDFSFITEKTLLFKWGIYIRPIIKHIKYKNLTLLGDAAHPIVPFIGQGGCLAMEDAFIFGNLVIKYDSDISSAQSKYEKLRMKRIKMISKLSLRQGYLNHLSNPLIVLIRNLIMRYLPFLALRSIKSNVWEYDPKKDL